MSLLLVINADIFSDYNYKNLKNRSLQKKSIGHLVLVNNPEHNLKGDFGIMDDGILTMNSEKVFDLFRYSHL